MPLPRTSPQRAGVPPTDVRRFPLTTMTMPWLYLFVAGLLEIGWAVGLKLSDGFSRPLPAFLTVVAMIGSFGLLAMALRSLPLGTAYAVWVGIGAAGTAIVGTLVFNEPLGASRIFFISLLIAGVLGLKLTHAG